jgi:hypothetical protein
MCSFKDYRTLMYIWWTLPVISRAPYTLYTAGYDGRMYTAGETEIARTFEFLRQRSAGHSEIMPRNLIYVFVWHFRTRF